MTENLQINAVEDKVTIKGVAYVRANTNLGWLACFDKDSCPILKTLIGKTAVVELKSSVANKGTPEEKVFQNIAKVLGEAQGNMAKGEEDIIKPEVIPVVKMNNRTARTDTFHTAYAKDVFIALVEKTNKEKITTEDLMRDAIKIVQMAKDAFE